MTQKDRQIAETFSQRFRQRYPAARIWAFGSRVRGDARWDSDFDVCVVLDNADRQADLFLRQVAWEVGFDHERVISPILMDRNGFEHGPASASTLVDHILHRGLAV